MESDGAMNKEVQKRKNDLINKYSKVIDPMFYMMFELDKEIDLEQIEKYECVFGEMYPEVIK